MEGFINNYFAYLHTLFFFLQTYTEKAVMGDTKLKQAKQPNKVMFGR